MEVKHLLLAKFKDGVSEQQIQELINSYANLVNLIEPMKAFKWGKDVSIENLHQGFTHVFESSFESTEGVAEYIGHPAHVEYANQLLPQLEKELVELGISISAQDCIDMWRHETDYYRQYLLEEVEDCSRSLCKSVVDLNTRYAYACLSLIETQVQEAQMTEDGRTILQLARDIKVEEAKESDFEAVGLAFDDKIAKLNYLVWNKSDRLKLEDPPFTSITCAFGEGPFLDALSGEEPAPMPIDDDGEYIMSRIQRKGCGCTNFAINCTVCRTVLTTSDHMLHISAMGQKLWQHPTMAQSMDQTLPE